MALDYTKLPKLILLDQINTDNPSHTLTDAQVTFGLPTVSTGGTPARDTEITVTAVAGSGYTGSVILRYNRVDLSTVPGVLNKVFSLGDGTTVADLIPEINTRYGINLQAEDYVDAALPAFDGTPNEQHDFSVVANADSLVWRGTLVLTVKSEDIPLSTALTTTTLNGLVYTSPV